MRAKGLELVFWFARTFFHRFGSCVGVKRNHELNNILIYEVVYIHKSKVRRDVKQVNYETGECFVMLYFSLRSKYRSLYILWLYIREVSEYDFFKIGRAHV